MIVIAILAILVSLALPNVSGGMRQATMRSATQEIMHLVDFARVQAMARNRAYEFKVDASGNKFTVNESSNTKCSGFASGLKDVRTLVLDVADTDFEDVKVIKLSPTVFSSSPSLCFRPNGSVLLTSTTVPVKSDDADYGAGDALITIQRSGNKPSLKYGVLIPYNGIPRFVAGG